MPKEFILIYSMRQNILSGYNLKVHFPISTFLSNNFEDYFNNFCDGVTLFLFPFPTQPIGDNTKKQIITKKMNYFNQQRRSYSTAKEKRVYKTTSSGSVTSYVTRNLDDPANDFSILQALGCDPKHVNIHKKIVNENKGL